MNAEYLIVFVNLSSQETCSNSKPSHCLELGSSVNSESLEHTIALTPVFGFQTCRVIFNLKDNSFLFILSS